MARGLPLRQPPVGCTASLGAPAAVPEGPVAVVGADRPVVGMAGVVVDVLSAVWADESEGGVTVVAGPDAAGLFVFREGCIPPAAALIAIKMTKPAASQEMTCRPGGRRRRRRQNLRNRPIGCRREGDGQAG